MNTPPKANSPMALAQEAHPTQSTRGGHSRDQRMRDAGFEILKRPKTGPNIWRDKETKEEFLEEEAWEETLLFESYTAERKKG